MLVLLEAIVLFLTSSIIQSIGLFYLLKIAKHSKPLYAFIPLSMLYYIGYLGSGATADISLKKRNGWRYLGSVILFFTILIVAVFIGFLSGPNVATSTFPYIIALLAGTVLFIIRWVFPYRMYTRFTSSKWHALLWLIVPYILSYILKESSNLSNFAQFVPTIAFLTFAFTRKTYH